MYKTEIIGFTKNRDTRAQAIQDKANEMYNKGYELVSVTSTPNAGAILIFRQR